MTGEISSDYIYRNSLKQKQSNVTHVEEPEDDDEQFISNMKMIIDKNYMQNKENYSIRDLQSKSYLSRKKKCAFSDEDQNLIKRFKKSVEESKVSCVAPQKLQQSEQIASVHSRHASTTCTPQITPIVGRNDIDVNFRCNTEKLLFHAASETQRNDQCITPEIAKTITEIEIEQLIFHEMEYFTPPQKDDLSFIKKI
ncbi:uncharacterized protein LOC105434098 [Pogonomyrmex barbatus]|uniref:Uncharacterized protein LOC105434098 n=1 Tax=Pogonomyrmex barbatus TaxID=144034 RepID=A0A6I9X5F4_9HYME|nr:uncharacterized protein LOC105434098 [Pogonomyrmex barbatus]